MTLQEELLPDWLWEEIRPLLPVHTPSPQGGRPRADDRPCVLALIYLLREGGTWRRLPRRDLACPSYPTVWRRFHEWSNAGVWDLLHKRVLIQLSRLGAIDTTHVVADSASVRALFGGSTPDPIPPIAAKKG
jgi:transposase